jgi:uncharacterized protein (TIGR02145 family)
MKYLSILFLPIIFFHYSIAQNVGIGTNSPNASAQLDVSSTTKGFLPPRMTVAQRNSISNPVAGLQIWCIDCKQLQVYDGSTWINIGGATPVIPNVVICSQVWMSKNLDVTVYQNWDPIPQVTDPIKWAALTTGAWCWYNNDSATYASTYGRLYNWYAVNDPRGLAPQGWHVPSDGEWSTLSTCLGGDFVAGGKLKEAGTAHWLSPNTNADNSSFFGALPCGYRIMSGTFNFLGIIGYFWSTLDANTYLACSRKLTNTSSSLARTYEDKTSAFSIRCIRD